MLKHLLFAEPTRTNWYNKHICRRIINDARKNIENFEQKVQNNKNSSYKLKSLADISTKANKLSCINEIFFTPIINFGLGYSLRRWPNLMLENMLEV